MFLGLSDLDWITRISLEREREREVGFWWLESFFWRILVSLRVEESKERKKLEEGSNLGHCLSVISIEFYCWMIELRF